MSQNRQIVYTRPTNTQAPSAPVSLNRRGFVMCPNAYGIDCETIQYEAQNLGLVEPICSNHSIMRLLALGGPLGSLEGTPGETLGGPLGNP